MEDSHKSKGLLEDMLKEKSMKSDEITLADFLNISSSDWFGKDRKQEMDVFLNRNFSRRLFVQTFNNIERQIIMRRLSSIYVAKTQNIINCVECTK